MRWAISDLLVFFKNILALRSTKWRAKDVSFMFYAFHSHNVVRSHEHDNYDVVNTVLPTWHEGNNMQKSATRCILNAYLYSSGTRNYGWSQGCDIVIPCMKSTWAYIEPYRRVASLDDLPAGGQEEKVSCVFPELQKSVWSL